MPVPSIPPPARRRVLLAFGIPALALAGALLAAPDGRADTYYLDANAGVDDAGRDATLPGQPWRSVTFALGQIDTSIANELRLAAGTYGRATGEVFPIELPPRLMLIGRGSDRTVILDDRDRGEETLRWEVNPPETLNGQAGLTDLAVQRRTPNGEFKGRGLYVIAYDTTASPVLTNVVMKGHEKGLSLEAFSEYAAATNRTRVLRSQFVDNETGVFGLAYTYGGGVADMSPTFDNTVMSGNRADGAWFESGASVDLSPGNRSAATSSPVITHSTLADNIGSGVVLYSYNYGYPAGAVRATVRSSILGDNGDYSVLENWSNTDATTFTDNMLGGEQLALYLDEGVNPLLTIAEVNAAVRSTTNFAGEPAFVRALGENWHLRADSPGVDAVPNGVLGTDIDGDTRPVDGDGDGTATADAGADEAQPCAVTAVVDPPQVDDLCGPGTNLTFDATMSAPTDGFTCSVPLTFQWYADDVPLGTDPVLDVTADRTTTWTVVVSCADYPACSDAEKRTVIVHDLPTVDAGGPYEACIAPGQTALEIPLVGTAEAVPGTFIETWFWQTTPDWPVLGGATGTPSVFVDDTGVNQDITVTATVLDSHGCLASKVAQISVWRAPEVDLGGPYDACQDPDALSEETAVPLFGTATSPPGSVPVSWLWTASVGTVVNETTPSPHLLLRNVPVTRTSTVTATVTDDHGCTSTAMTDVRIQPSPLPNAGGPYQQQEDPGGTTTFALDGSGSVPVTTITSWDWTTSIGTFRESGTSSVSLTSPTLDVVNTGADQTALLTLTVTDANGCAHATPTTARVRTTPPVPPNGVGATFLLRKVPGTLRLRWQNPPIDDMHDLATHFAVWQSTTPAAGGWAPRAGLDNVPPGSGVTQTFAPGLLDPAEPDWLFLKVVAANDAGTSCPDPATELPDCP